MREKRKTFSREFKLEALRLMEEGKKPPAELARELGIRRNQLYKWKEKADEHGGSAFPGSGRHESSGTKTAKSGDILLVFCPGKKPAWCLYISYISSLYFF